MAPEVVNGVTYDIKADVWSFGIILYFMLTGVHPFNGIDEITNKELNMEPLKEFSPCLQFLLSRLLHKDQKARITMAQAI